MDNFRVNIVSDIYVKDSEMVIIGESPHNTEIEYKIPLVGESGQRFTEMMTNKTQYMPIGIMAQNAKLGISIIETSNFPLGTIDTKYIKDVEYQQFNRFCNIIREALTRCNASELNGDISVHNILIKLHELSEKHKDQSVEISDLSNEISSNVQIIEMIITKIKSNFILRWEQYSFSEECIFLILGNFAENILFNLLKENLIHVRGRWCKSLHPSKKNAGRLHHLTELATNFPAERRVSLSEFKHKFLDVIGTTK